jgi:hypothetical protein
MFSPANVCYLSGTGSLPMPGGPVLCCAVLCCAVLCCAVLCCVLIAAGSLPWKELMAEFWGPLEQAVSAANKVSTTQASDEGKLGLLHPAPFPPLDSA